jgi:hypothetical protein
MVVTTALKGCPLFLQLQFPSAYVSKTKKLVPSEGCLMIITVNRMARELEKL